MMHRRKLLTWRNVLAASLVCACIAEALSHSIEAAEFPESRSAPPAVQLAQLPAAKSNNLKLDIPYNSISYNVAPLWMAVDGGFFKRYGIDAKTEFFAQSPAIVASMLSGESQFAMVGQDVVINAGLNGGDIVILASGPEKPPFSIYAAPSIHDVAGLRGKKIGVTQFGTTTDFIARYILKKARLQPADVTIVPMGPAANVLAGLLGGLVDAGVLGSDAVFRGKELASYKEIANMLDYDLLFYVSSLVAKKSWVVAHPDDTMNVVRGYLSGMATAATNKSETVKVLRKYTHATDTDGLEEAYRLLTKSLPRIPVPKSDALQAGLNEMTRPGAKGADPARFIDPTFVNELQRDGFIDNLYR